MKQLQALLASCVLVALSLTTSCSSVWWKPAPGATWVTQETGMVSERVLWVVCENAMVKQSFPVLAKEFDPKTREAHSGWSVDLHPFKNEGFRERAVIGYDLGSSGKLRIRVRVEREVNENLARPLDPSLAEWAREADNAGRAQVLMQTIISTLATR